MEVVDMDLEDGELDGSPPLVWSAAPIRSSADFNFLFGQQDIDLRHFTHVPVLSADLRCPPPLIRPDQPLDGSGLHHAFPDRQSGRVLDVDTRIPFAFANGMPAIPFFPAHIPLQPLHPNLSHQSYVHPEAAATGFTPYSRQSEPLLVDLTADEEPYHLLHDQSLGVRQKPSAVKDSQSMKQVLDRDQTLLSPYEPADFTFIPISGSDFPADSSTPLRDETSVVYDWLENALTHASPQSPVNMSANKKKSDQRLQKKNQRRASPVRDMENSVSGDKRSRSSSSSSHWDKRRKSESGDVYQYKEITVIDHRTRRKSDSRPGTRNESHASSNARSRRKIKRQEARKVHTVTAAAASPAIPAAEVPSDGLLSSDMRDAPIEVLMAHLEQLKRKLVALSEAEKSDTAPVGNERPVSKTIESAEPCVIEKQVEEEEEEDIGELRRIAILSMKAQALEDSAVALSSPVPVVSQPPDEDDDDMDTLRQQLLMSMKQNRDKRNETNVQTVTAVPPEAVSVLPIASASPARRVMRNKSSDQGIGERLVIEFGGSSESESEGDDVTISEPPGLTSLLAAARNNCKNADLVQLPASIQKLTIDQQREYIRLKNEIAKREKHVGTAAPLLAANEKKYKQLSESIRSKRMKLESIKESVTKKKDQYLKADAHAKKMEELLAAARTTVQHTLSELRRLTQELTETQQALVAESAEVRAVDQECLRLGKEVDGASYVQPSKKVTVKLAAKPSHSQIVQEKNRLMARKSAILSLVQEKRSSSHSSSVQKRKTSRSSPRKLPALHALRKCNISRNGRENKDPKIVKTKKKKKPAKEENFETSVALLFDRHLKEKAKEEAAGVAAIEYLVERPPVIVPHTECVRTGMPSFRLSPLFHKAQSRSLLCNTYSNALDPFQVVCYFDLHGVCKDPKCEMQHKSSYLLKDREKLMDIVSYRPSLAGVSGDELLDKQKVYEKVEEFVERFTASQSSKSVDEIAVQLVKLVRHGRSAEPAGRAGRPDYTHRASFDVKHFKYAFNGELNADGTGVSAGVSESDDE